MSGTVIMIPVDGPEVLLLEFTFDAVAEMAGSVKYALDEYIYSAVHQRDEDKKQLIEWQEFRQSLMAGAGAAAEVEAAVRAVEDRLAAVQLDAAAQRDSADLSSQEQVSAVHRQLGRNRLTGDAAAGLLAEIGEILKAAPASLRDAPGNPAATLKDQYARFCKRLGEGEVPDAEEFNGLRDTVLNTLRGHAESMQRKQDARQVLLQRLEPILDILLFTRQAALAAHLDARDLVSEMDALRTQLLALCQDPEPREGAVSFLERRIKELQRQTDKMIVNQAQRRGLAAAVVQHLTGMGYAVVQDFAEPDAGSVNQAAFRIPGGEQVRVAIHPNLQMAFEVVHERGPGQDVEAPVSVAEQAHFMRQENRWCQDHRELMRRLIAEGFPYRVSFERHILEFGIKVVVVESADELADSEEFMDDGTTSRRTLD